MSAPPYMQLYVAVYTADVQHLTCEQDGAYWRLLRAMWQAGGKLPNVPRKLAIIVGLSEERWAEVGPDVLGLFVRRGGILTHKRVTAALDKASAKSEVRKEAGKRGGTKTANKNKDKTEAFATANETVCSSILKTKDSVSSNEETSAQAREPVREAFEAWNDLALRLKLPLAKDLTHSRRAAIKARLAEHGLDGWRDALAGVAASKFCRGLTERVFRADLDFVCQQKSYQRLRERFYGEDAGPSAKAPTPQVPVAEWTPARWRLAVEGYNDTRRWNEAWGPEPGQPCCGAPADLLQEYGYPFERSVDAA